MRLMRCVSPPSTSSSSLSSASSRACGAWSAPRNSRRRRWAVMPIALSGLRTSCATVDASSPIAASRSRRRSAASAAACFSERTPNCWRSTTKAIITMPSASAAASDSVRRVSVRRSARRRPSRFRPRRRTGLPARAASTGPVNSRTGVDPTANSPAASPSSACGMGTDRNAAPDGVGAAVAASASGPYAMRFVPSSRTTYAISGARAAMSCKR